MLLAFLNLAPGEAQTHNLGCVLPYKYRKLTDCTTGADALKVNYQTPCSLARLIFQILQISQALLIVQIIQ